MDNIDNMSIILPVLACAVIQIMVYASINIKLGSVVRNIRRMDMEETAISAKIDEKMLTIAEKQNSHILQISDLLQKKLDRMIDITDQKINDLQFEMSRKLDMSLNGREPVQKPGRARPNVKRDHDAEPYALQCQDQGNMG